MKRFLSLFAVVSTLVLFTVSCEDSGDIGDYVPPTVAVGVDSSYKPDVIAVVPGYDRAEVIWDLNSEGRTIEKSYIYWVNTQTGAEGAYEATTSADLLDDTGYYRQTFDIPEGNYTFYIRNLDSDKYISASSLTLENTIYGAVTESELLARPIESLSYSDTNNVYVLIWGECDDCIGSSVTYTRTNGDIYTLDGGTDATLTMYSATKEDMITVTSQHIPYRAVYKDGLDAEVLAALNIENTGLDEIELSAVRKFSGDNTKFKYLESIADMWALFEEWEDYRTDEQIAAGDVDVIAYSDATEQGLVDNLARKSNWNITMKAGIHEIDADDVLPSTSGTGYNGSGYFYPTFTFDTSDGTTTYKSIIMVTGDNNYFDFTDATFHMSTEAFTSFGSGTLQEIGVYGDGNTIKNLTFKDVGSPYDLPGGSGQGLCIDGRNNLIEDLNYEIRGSTPYGYGELFGKGSNNVIGHSKRSAFLIRGEYNTARRCNIYSESYGHLVFVQAGWYTTIEDCYIESCVSTTDKVLEERGFGTAADLVNFMTYWGFTVPEGYSLPLSEDGYRKYTSGSTFIRGTGGSTANSESLTSDYKFNYLERGTGYVSIRNCTAVNARSGISFRLGTGGAGDTVENMTLKGCGSGFQINRYGVIGSAAQPCRADCKYGHAMGMAYGVQDSYPDYNNYAHIELIPYEGTHLNKSGQVTYIQGYSHYLYFYEGEGLFYEDDLWIKLGGLNKSLGSTSKVPYGVTNVRLYNYTYYPVLLGWNTKNSASSSRAGNYIYVKTKKADGTAYITPIDVEDVNGDIVAVGSAEYKELLSTSENYIYDIDNISGGMINSTYLGLEQGYEWKSIYE